MNQYYKVVLIVIIAIACIARNANASQQHNIGVTNSAGVRVLDHRSNQKRLFPPPERCTTIAVTPEASIESASYSTHTNDCKDCDFRLSLIKAKNWPADALRPVGPSRFAYPRYIGDDRGETLKSSAVDYSIYSWKATAAVGYIPQLSHTYAWIDGVYGIMNEKQVAIGESTCGARLLSKPVYAGGQALFDISELSRIAVERASTAREAISIIGDLSTRYGYYGAEWEGDLAFGEAGEALSIVDPKEAWIFHILPDDTGSSAVWAAQRVPPGHVAVVANAFIIKEINFTDTDNFLYSSNIKDVAIRSNFWNPDLSGDKFHFSDIYGAKIAFEEYCTHRQWRVFTLVAPTLSDKISYNMTTDQLPFSVKVDKLISAHDVMTIQRDHYEGTDLDMTKGLAAGPFGNPNRYDRGSAEGVSMGVIMQGTFERAISLFRTSYSFVTVSRSSVPDLLGYLWFAHAAPHASLYLPLFPFADSLPTPHTIGSLYRVTRPSSFWATTLIQNWAERAYQYIITDIQSSQLSIENDEIAKQKDFEAELSSLIDQLKLSSPPTDTIQKIKTKITDYQNHNAVQRIDAWWQFFDFLVAKYHDGYRLDDFHAETINPTPLFYPLSWLKAVGFFPGNKVDSNKTKWSYTINEPTVTPYQPKSQIDIETTNNNNNNHYRSHKNYHKTMNNNNNNSPMEIQTEPSSSMFSILAPGIFIAVAFFSIGLYIGKKTAKRSDYELIH